MLLSSFGYRFGFKVHWIDCYPGQLSRNILFKFSKVKLKSGTSLRQQFQFMNYHISPKSNGCYRIGKLENFRSPSRIVKFPNYLKFGVGCSVALIAGEKSTLAKVVWTKVDFAAYCDGRVGEASTEHDRLQGSESAQEISEPHLSWLQLWQLLKPQSLYFVAAVLSALIVALSNIQIPQLLGEVVNVLAKFSQEKLNQNIVFMNEIIKPSVKILKMYLIQASFTFLYIAFLTRMGERMANDLRLQLFDSLLQQDIAFYDWHKTGELVNRLTADVQDFKSSFKMVISQGMRSVTQIIGCGMTMYSISPQMTGLTAVVVPSVIAVGTVLGSVLRSISRDAQQQVGLATAVADECLNNIRTVRAFAMEEEEFKLFAREADRSNYINEMLGMGIGIFQAGASMLLNGVVLATLFTGGSMISSGKLEAGGLMSFLVSSQTIQRSLSQLSIVFGTFVRGVSAGARVFEYINERPSVALTGGAKIPYHSLIGEVEFHDVSFVYPTRPGQAVLKNFSLKIPSGKVVAIVGASGAGKSTLAQLLERFYDASEGSITIDGKDIRDLNPSWLRRTVLGFINQEPILFATSIMENIRYGRPDATDEEVRGAARTANAEEFIEGFAKGYETVVGERGVTVSGGQKQRIAIARALIKNPTLLILDEATSALDAESEAVVQKALEKCCQGRTVIIIAHRLSTIKNADVIAVMSHGRVAELGTHEQLKNLGGIYAALIKQQQQESTLWNFL